MIKVILFLLLFVCVGEIQAQTTISGGTFSGAEIGNVLQQEINIDLSNGLVTGSVANRGLFIDQGVSGTNVLTWADLSGNGHPWTTTTTVNTTNSEPVVGSWLTNRFGFPVQAILFNSNVNDLCQLRNDSIAPLMSGTTNQLPFTWIVVVNTPFAGIDAYTGFGHITSGSANKDWLLIRPNAGGGNRTWAVSMATTTNATIVSKTLTGPTDMSTNRWCVQAVTFDGAAGNIQLFSNLDTNSNNTLTFIPNTNSVFDTMTMGIRRGNTANALFGKKYLGAYAETWFYTNALTILQTTNKIATIIQRNGF